MKVKYLGELRTEGVHLKSGNTVITDAPTDNHGKGEAFSPTDLMCTSLAGCMISLLGIVGADKNIAIGQIDADIEKIMASDPRRVIKINIVMRIQDMNYTDRDKAILENTAKTCPVAKSLHPDIEQNLEIIYY